MAAEGTVVSYTVRGQSYEGYFISPSNKAPLVVLVHDWDGLTDYEVKRAQMLADAGYAVLAADLFGAGVRPTEVKDKRQHTGELYKDREKMRALLNGALAVAKSKGTDVSNAVAAGYRFWRISLSRGGRQKILEAVYGVSSGESELIIKTKDYEIPIEIEIGIGIGIAQREHPTSNIEH
jgi:hypothetical protein